MKTELRSTGSCVLLVIFVYYYIFVLCSYRCLRQKRTQKQKNMILLQYFTQNHFLSSLFLIVTVVFVHQYFSFINILVGKRGICHAVYVPNHQPETVVFRLGNKQELRRKIKNKKKEKEERKEKRLEGKRHCLLVQFARSKSF